MAARTIRSGIGTYMDADGQWVHGVLGDDVDVHEDDLERFDRLNPDPPEPTTEPEDEASKEPSFSQEDVDAAVKAATEAQVAELAQAKAELEAARAELAKKPTPAKSPAKQS